MTEESKPKKEWVSIPWDPTSEAHKQSMLDLRRAHDITPDICTPEFFDWQYRNTPWGAAEIRVAVPAHDHTRVVGQYAVHPVEYSCGGKTTFGGVAVNLLVDAEYRRLGIFLRLITDSYELWRARGFNFVIGYPNPNSSGSHTRQLRAVDVGDIPLAIRFLRLSETVRKRFPIRPLAGLATLIARPFNFIFDASKKNGAGVETVTHFDEAFDEFNGQLMKRFPVMVKRSARYLNWRYIQSPLEYHALALRRDGKIQGYVIYRVMDFAGMRCGMVLDFVLRGDDRSRDAADELLPAALNGMQSKGCDLVGALSLPGYLERKMLLRWKFFICPKKLRPQPFPFIIYNYLLDPDLKPNVHDLKNWFVAIGDYDAA